MPNEVARTETLKESGTLRKARWGYSRAIVSKEEQKKLTSGRKNQCFRRHYQHQQHPGHRLREP